MFPSNNLYSKPLISVEPIATSRENSYLKNHQKWQISRQLSLETGFPALHLIDAHGLKHVVTEYVVEDMDESDRQELIKLKTVEEQQQKICQYLQKKLSQATPFELHVDNFKGVLVIRFGKHGLQGGGKKKRYCLLLGLTSLLGGGLILGGFFGNLLYGGTLISGGISGAKSAYEQKPEKFNGNKVLIDTAVGILTGLLTGTLLSAAKAATLVWSTGSQMLGSGMGCALSETADQIQNKDQHAELNKGKIAKKFGIGLVGGLAGKATGNAVGRLCTALAPSMNFLTSTVQRLSSRIIEGGASSGAATLTTNLCDSDVKEKDKEVLLSIILGAFVGGAFDSIDSLRRPKKVMMREVPKFRCDSDTAKFSDLPKYETVIPHRPTFLNGSDFLPNRSGRGYAGTANALRPETNLFNVEKGDDSIIRSHVVLVQALTYDMNYGYGVDQSQKNDHNFCRMACINRAVSPKGVVGHHLQNLDQQNINTYIQVRPQTHWAWNQLVQPNSGGLYSWEDTDIALLEPIGEFKNHPFGVAPYDTMIFGEHSLSE